MNRRDTETQRTILWTLRLCVSAVQNIVLRTSHCPLREPGIARALLLPKSQGRASVGSPANRPCKEEGREIQNPKSKIQNEDCRLGTLELDPETCRFYRSSLAVLTEA